MAKKINNVGKQLVPVSKPPWLVDELIAEQLRLRHVGRMISALTLIEKLFPEMGQQERKLHHFEWPECPIYEQLAADAEAAAR